jgi:hypothetical protein
MSDSLKKSVEAAHAIGNHMFLLRVVDQRGLLVKVEVQQHGNHLSGEHVSELHLTGVGEVAPKL